MKVNEKIGFRVYIYGAILLMFSLGFYFGMVYALKECGIHIQ
jgi:hypothetical protein